MAAAGSSWAAKPPAAALAAATRLLVAARPPARAMPLSMTLITGWAERGCLGSGEGGTFKGRRAEGSRVTHEGGGLGGGH